jgi:hypothetical protein
MVVYIRGSKMALLICNLCIKGYTYSNPLYCRVISPASSKLNTDLIVGVYASKERRDAAPHSPIDTLTFPLAEDNRERFTCEAFKIEGNEPFTASYEYLKTLYTEVETV